jgi:hypothetical protein
MASPVFPLSFGVMASIPFNLISGKNSNYRYGFTLQVEHLIASANGKTYSLDKGLLMGDSDCFLANNKT